MHPQQRRGNARAASTILIRARHCARILSFVCLLLFTGQLASEASVAFVGHSGELPSMQPAAESHRSACLASNGRAEGFLAAIRNFGPSTPDSRIVFEDRRLAPKRRPASPVILHPLHRPPHSLMRQRLRLSSGDDVPG